MSDAVPAKRKLGDFLPSFGGKAGKASPFLRALIEGLLAGLFLFIIMVVWMFLRAGDTARSLQPLVPYQTAAIEEPAAAITPQDKNAPGDVLENAKNIVALPPAPIEGLSESKDGRVLPISRIEDDMTPFQAYRKPFTPVPGRGMVSIVVVDFGLSEKISDSMLENLPPEISFVLNSYAADPAKWASAARAYGHEFWIGLPMQTDNSGDAGPNAIEANAPLEQNQQRLLNVMGSAAGYAGLVTQQGHTLKSDDPVAPGILNQIFGRGLALAESNPAVAAFGLPLAMEEGFPYVQNSYWIDADLRPDHIDRVLGEIEMQAAAKGKVVAFLRPYPAVLQKVQEWMQDADKRGIQIAPLSAMVQ